IGMTRFSGSFVGSVYFFMDKILPVKSIVKWYSLHRKTNKSETLTFVKLFAMVSPLISGDRLIFILCISDSANKKLDSVILLTLISLLTCSVRPGLSTAKTSRWFFMV